MSYSALLRIPAFRRLWLGQVISQLGDSFYFVSFMFMVQKVTGSVAMVGFSGACETMPFLLFSLYGGVLADRIDRRKIMLWSDLLSGVVLVTLAVVVAIGGKPPVWSLLVTPFLLSTFRSCFLPAKNAAIPALVPADALLSANALSATSQSIVPMISLGLTAGVLSSFYNRSAELFLILAVSLNSISFFISAAYIARLPKIEPIRSGVSEVHPWTDLVDGLKFIKRERVLVVLLAVQSGLSLAVSPFFVVYIAANNAWFGGQPQSLACFELAFSVGMVVSSISLGKLNITKPGMSFILGTFAIGLTVFAMAFSRNFTLFVFWNLAAGLAVPMADIPVRTWMQSYVPDAFRGRVNSLYSMIQVGSSPIGLCLGGLVVARVGIQVAFLGMGGAVAAAALTGLLDRSFRLLKIDNAKPAAE